MFESPEVVINRFEKKKGSELAKLDLHSYTGKRLRGELLIHLKEKAGLAYPEMGKIPLFQNLKMVLLGRLYQEVKKRLDGNR